MFWNFIQKVNFFFIIKMSVLFRLNLDSSEYREKIELHIFKDIKTSYLIKILREYNSDL